MTCSTEPRTAEQRHFSHVPTLSEHVPWLLRRWCRTAGQRGLQRACRCLPMVCRGQALRISHTERSLRGWAQGRDAWLTRSSRKAVVDCGEPTGLDLIRWSRFTRNGECPAVDRRDTVRLDSFAARRDVLPGPSQACSDFDHRHDYGKQIQNKLLHAQR